MKVNWLALVMGLGITGALVTVFALGFGKDPHAVPSVLETQPAPTFTLTTLDGSKEVSLASLKGKKVVLNFWSTWCLPCKAEHGLLQQAAQRWPDTQFLGVLYSDKPELAVRYLAKKGSAYPNLVDPLNRTAIDYGVAGVPETFFINEKGIIVYKHVGPLSAPDLIYQLDGES